MAGFGLQSVGTVGRSIQVSCDGKLEAKAGGVTIDWTTVTASAGAGTLPDNVPYAIGDKYLRYGQVLTKIAASGKFGPYDPDAVDGRQLLVRGDCHIVNETVFENDPKSDYPPTLEGGMVWLARVIQSGVGAASLAAGPTLANLTTAFPRLRFNHQA